ncbi:uncharacterized, partial [Tachysurus ichikawai]
CNMELLAALACVVAVKQAMC